MNEGKTQPTNMNVLHFINSVENDRRRNNALTLLNIFTEETGEEAVMWGSSIIGFGSYHYKYDTGREGDCQKTGFSPRKANLVLYVMSGTKANADLISKLGPHKTGVVCIYLTRLDKIDLGVLRQIIRSDFQKVSAKYG